MPTHIDKMTPVPVTRGSGTPILSQKLHHIEGTFKKGNAVSVPDILPSKFVECRAFNGYTVGSLYEDGRILMTNPNRPEMGAHLLWHGQACDNCPIDHIWLLNHLREAGFSFTQLDLAIDAINFNLRPQQATEELKHGRCKTRAKLSPRRDDPRDPGYTQYVGKKTSEIFLKLYDKAEEMGIDADHCRIELTVRHGRANKAAWQIVHGVDFRSLWLLTPTSLNGVNGRVLWTLCQLNYLRSATKQTRNNGFWEHVLLLLPALYTSRPTQNSTRNSKTRS